MGDFSELLALSADLGKASTDVTRKAQAVLRKTAHDVEADGKRFAPVDTGTLRNSVGTTITNGGMSAEIGPTVDYAPYVEFGTRRMAPRAFMGPALDRHSGDFVKAVEQLGGDFL